MQRTLQMTLLYTNENISRLSIIFNILYIPFSYASNISDNCTPSLFVVIPSAVHSPFFWQINFPMNSYIRRLVCQVVLHGKAVRRSVIFFLSSHTINRPYR